MPQNMRKQTDASKDREERRNLGKGDESGSQFYFMNIILHSQRSKGQPKPAALKVVMGMRRQRRSVTQQHQQSTSPPKQSQIHQQITLEDQLKPKDFTSIFAKHRRSQYSGYKQVNMNQSPIIKLSTEAKVANRYEVSRKYEINLKNIAKLRKRHSLEPIHFKESQRSHRMFFGDRERTKAILTLEEIDTGRRCHRELKDAIREMSNRHHSASEKCLEKEEQLRMNQKVNDSSIRKHEEKLAQGELSPIVKKAVQIQQMPKLIAIHKSSYKGKKTSRIRIPLMDKRRQSEIEQDVLHSGENQLHGWSTHSFYPKRRPFFQQPTKPDPSR